MHLVLVGPDDGHWDDRPGARGGDDRPRPHARTRRSRRSTCIRTRTCSACPRPARASAWPPPKPPLPERRSSSPTGAASPASSGKEALVVPYSAAALTDALRRVLTDEALRRSLSAGGVAAARQLLGARVGSPGGDLPRGDCFPAGFDEGFDRGVVAPAETRARERSVVLSQHGIDGEQSKRVGGCGCIPGRHQHAVLAISQEIRSCAHAVGQDERQAGRRRLVDGHTPARVPTAGRRCRPPHRPRPRSPRKAHR